MKQHPSRRNAIKKLAGSALAFGAAPLLGNGTDAARSVATEEPSFNERNTYKLKGRINHSIAQWTTDYMPLEELCQVAKGMGLKAIDLLTPAQFATVQKYDLSCSMCYTAGKVSLTEGFNRTGNHDWLVRDIEEAIPVIKAAGYTNLICFSGNRDGMDDITGMDNCVTGLKRVMPLAEKHGIVIQMELFNSKIDHKDYMADRSLWGVELCKKLGSENFKLLFDIYHMQVNEGDVIRSIQQNHRYFGHYHTAGVPGRHEIGQDQELYYPAIMNAIIATGFKGHVAQEFIATGKDKTAKINALKTAVKICDV